MKINNVLREKYFPQIGSFFRYEKTQLIVIMNRFYPLKIYLYTINMKFKCNYNYCIN